ncbi:hypothetical protein ACFV3R_26800 [Streptomyces sp. NPDC059740]|uniref:hypothetical protein n=1 Tax=Streptomyces sp. NPDC059740 TaxID=3346926 RepID=UPI003646452B
MIAISLGFLGLAVLAVFAARVYTEVRRLAGQVDKASNEIERAARELNDAAGPLAAQTGHFVQDVTSHTT